MSHEGPWYPSHQPRHRCSASCSKAWSSWRSQPKHVAAGQTCKAEPSLYSAAIGREGEKEQAEREDKEPGTAFL